MPESSRDLSAEVDVSLTKRMTVMSGGEAIGLPLSNIALGRYRKQLQPCPIRRFKTAGNRVGPTHHHALFLVP